VERPKMYAVYEVRCIQTRITRSRYIQAYLRMPYSPCASCVLHAHMCVPIIYAIYFTLSTRT